MSEDLPITVLGAGGWIGAALVNDLQRQGKRVLPVSRTGLPTWLACKEPPGTVIYAIGLTGDFRERPHATAEAHVGLLSHVLQRKGLEKFLFLSSTRVYSRSADTREAAPLPCLSSDPSDLYNLSKLLGEALVLQDPRPGLKVVRLSNVIGYGQPISTFIGSLLVEAREQGLATIQQSPDTSKDYVALVDVVRLLPQIAINGRHRLYNLGSGYNKTHADVAAWLNSQGLRARFAVQTYSGLSFPQLSVDRLILEFERAGDPFAGHWLRV
jgi:nucleoside-diphosphate-sugar epimerase